MEAAQAIRVLATAKSAAGVPAAAPEGGQGTHEPVMAARLEQMLRSIAQATALAVALCIGGAALTPFLPGLASSANATTERDFTEET